MTNYDYFDDECSWPRWLLRIDTLTSHFWQPGNIYGGLVEPEYNAISYTWGRFALQEDEQTHIRAMPIRGIPWAKDLPRIRPSRFTIEELCRALKTAACPYSGYKSVTFIWLDIACINQNTRTAENASEIGRQAKIFQRAKDSFIWLPSHTSADIRAWGREMDRTVSHKTPHQQAHPWTKETGFVEVPPEEEEAEAASRSAWLNSASDVLDQFTVDPWFSSLWTLQEAFLSPRAIFIWRDGLTPEFLEDCRDGGGVVQFFNLMNWVQAWNMVKAKCMGSDFLSLPGSRDLVNRIDATGVLGGVRDQFLGQIDDLDFPLGATGNPFQLLAAASHRTTKRQEDRIYGIMQVFDLRLGRSAPNTAEINFTLEELEFQLASTLLCRHPVFSQLVIQPLPQQGRPTWMTTETISLPDEAFIAWSHKSFNGELATLTSFSTNLVSNVTWARFSGPLSSVKDLCKTVFSYGIVNSIDVALDEQWNGPMVASEPSNRSRTRVKKLEWIMSQLPDTRVLLLARLRPPPGYNMRSELNKFYDMGIGLLLQKREDTSGRYYHERIGIVTWDLDYVIFTLSTQKRSLSPKDLEYLDGIGDGWVLTEGLYG